MTRYDLINRALVEAPWDMVVEAGDPVNPNNEFWWSPQFRKTLGFTDEKDFPNVLSSWSDRLHPEDKESALQAFADHLNDHSGRTPFDIDYRLQSKMASIAGIMRAVKPFVMRRVSLYVSQERFVILR